jgi:hypothetical protein
VVPETIPSDPWAVAFGKTEKEMGKGYVIGREFGLIRNAKAGSIVRVKFTGAPLDLPDNPWGWGDMGAVGTLGMDSSFRVTIPRPIPPQPGAIFYREILAADLYRIGNFADVAFINVNVWGGHIIDEVMLMIPKEEQAAQNPLPRDFVITGVNQQYLDEPPITPFTVVPRFRMSQGAITIWYTGVAPTVYPKSETMPSIVGDFTVTFDVAAASGFNAATNLAAGNIKILATQPQGFHLPVTFIRNNDTQIQLNVNNTILAALRDSTYLVLSGNDSINADGFGGSQLAFNGPAPLNWSQSTLSPDWTSITHGPTDTFILFIRLANLTNYDTFLNETLGWRQIIIQNQRFEINTPTAGAFNITESYIANDAYLASLGFLPMPAGAAAITHGFIHVVK